VIDFEEAQRTQLDSFPIDTTRNRPRGSSWTDNGSGRTHGRPRGRFREGDAGISGEFALAGIHERAVSHARNEPTLANFRPTSAGRNFKRRAVSTARHRLSDHRLAIPAFAGSRRQVSAERKRDECGRRKIVPNSRRGMKR